MDWNFQFFLNSILLGFGLAMDAFSVSMANGLNEPQMPKSKMIHIAGTFAFFQALMPLLGWFCVHNFVRYFTALEPAIPWISLLLLCLIGGKMLSVGIFTRNKPYASAALGRGTLFFQGIATSIDAFSVGFTIAEYNWLIKHRFSAELS